MAAGNENIVVHNVFETHIRGVIVVTPEENIFRIGLWPNYFRKGEEGHPTPVHVELAPGGDAMEIARILELRKIVKLLPGEGFCILDQAIDLQSPLVRGNLRLNSKIENGKPAGEVLA